MTTLEEVFLNVNDQKVDLLASKISDNQSSIFKDSLDKINKSSIPNSCDISDLSYPSKLRDTMK